MANPDIQPHDMEHYSLNIDGQKQIAPQDLADKIYEESDPDRKFDIAAARVAQLIR